MTRQGKFKRAVRQRARETGKRYTQARAAMAKGKSAEPPTRPVERPALKEHLEDFYGMRITSLTAMDHPLTGKVPSTLLVRRKGAPPWVGRVFSSPVDKVSRVRGDAEILRFLARHDFPAERVAHDEPVSVLDGHGVIVTEFIQGGHPTDADAPQGAGSIGYGRSQWLAAWRELGSLLGRLHALPRGRGAVARDGGSLENDGGYFIGRPRQDLAAAMNTLVSVEDEVAPEARAGFEWLRDQVENAEDAEGLPEALTHNNYSGEFAVVGQPGNLSVVGWAGSGRGPRLCALGWLLWTTHGAELTEQVARGYSEHVQVTDEELDRLPGVINMRELYLACWKYARSVRRGEMPDLDKLTSRLNYTDQVAEWAMASFRR